MSLRVPAPAKVNLCLLVGPVDRRGYHQVFTVLVPVGVYDRLEFELEARPVQAQAGELHVRCHAVDGEANLVAQALRALERASGWSFSGRVVIDKGVPMGAGMGGGSTDAAVALRVGATVLQEAGGPVFDGEALYGFARALGADVPFFLDPRPAIGTGVGDVLEPIPLPKMAFALVFPEDRLSTARVYRTLDEARAAGETGHGREPAAGGQRLAFRTRTASAAAAWRRVRTVAEVAGLLQNDLESVSFGLLPPLGPVKQALLEAGAEGAMMSGSGPTLFGVCGDAAQAEVVARRMRDQGHSAAAVEVVTAVPA